MIGVGIMKSVLSAAIVLLLVTSLLFFPSPDARAASDFGSSPFTPHEVKVLVVSPANKYFCGAFYMISDLARYGFDVTHYASDDAMSTDYLTDSRTSDLSIYDVVILHGVVGFPPTRVSQEELNHFTNYNGTLIVIGNALFMNKTGAWWDQTFSTEPVLTLERRLGVDFTGFLGGGGAYHNGGTFTLTDNSIEGLPSTLQYATEQYTSINFQMITSLAGARTIYDFTVTSSPAPSLIGITAPGVTFYRRPDNAVGIYVQGAYIYGAGSGTQISYFGLTDIAKRSALLASLIAYSLQKDINTVIKPQPLASVRLDNVGKYFPQTYLDTSLQNFNSSVANYGISPTISFTDFLDSPEIPPYYRDYWRQVAPKVLTELKVAYSKWELSSSLRNKNVTALTLDATENLMKNINGNFSSLGIGQFSTVSTRVGYWNQTMLDFMSGANMSLIDSAGDAADLAKGFFDWWSLKVISETIEHSSVQMLPEAVWNASTLKFDNAENFTQPGLDMSSINYKYFSLRDKWALAVVEGFPSFIYYVQNFRQNQVGMYSLQVVYENLVSEIPDIRYVPLMEAGLYFGNKWMHLENVMRSESGIEFDLDSSAIPNVVGIGKGMTWLRINANDSIQQVYVDNNPWFYFDADSIRIPVSASLSHVKIVLGTPSSPQVVGSRYKVVGAVYDGYRMNVSMSYSQGFNVSVRVFLPQVGPFNASWGIFSNERRWNYNFDSTSRMLDYWSISDGFVSFQVGVFWTLDQTPPEYGRSVNVTANVTGMPVAISQVVLSYSANQKWFNVSMTYAAGAWSASIPGMPYGTAVQYRMYIFDESGHWLASGVFGYNVIDDIAPELGVPTWTPSAPAAGRSVQVEISANEPQDASGISMLRLWYYLGKDVTDLAKAISVNMTRDNDNTWSAAIPGQSDATTVSFFVMAYDQAGNTIQSEVYSYQVGFLISPFYIVLLGVGVAAGVAVVGYFVRFRKRKIQTKTPEVKASV